MMAFAVIREAQLLDRTWCLLPLVQISWDPLPRRSIQYPFDVNSAMTCE